MSRLAFPFAIAPTGRLAVVGEGTDAHVKQMLELLIMTEIAERPMRPDFGSPVRQMLFAPGDGATGLALQATLQSTIAQWMGHLIELADLSVAFDGANGRIDIQVTYRVRATLTVDRLELPSKAA
jgi:phage baseplate assembly protein W